MTPGPGLGGHNGDMTSDTPCPCGSGDSFGTCCGRFLNGDSAAPTAVQLMRSRYTAYALGNLEYVYDTWHPSVRPSRAELGAGADGGAAEGTSPAPLRWLHLAIESHEAGGPFDDEGTVTFRATARGPEGRVVLHERSRFVREGGSWLYLDGEQF